MKKIFSVIIIVAVLVSSVAVFSISSYAQGDTFDPANNSLSITTANDLQKFFTALHRDNNSFKGQTITLESDILINDISQSNWYDRQDAVKLEASGGSTAYFSGVFDGNGHTISGLIVETSGYGWWKGAAFIAGTRCATIKNLTLDGFRIIGNGATHVGGLIGRMDRGSTVENCKLKNGYITSDVAENADYVGVGGIFGVANMNTDKDVDGNISLFAQTIGIKSTVIENPVEINAKSGINCGGIGGYVYSDYMAYNVHVDLTDSKIQPKNVNNPIGKFKYNSNSSTVYLIVNMSHEYLEDLKLQNNGNNDFTSHVNAKIVDSQCYGDGYAETPKYNVTWIVDNTTICETYTRWEMPSFKEDIKEMTTKTFVSWNSLVVPVRADVTYIAQFESSDTTEEIILDEDIAINEDAEAEEEFSEALTDTDANSTSSCKGTISAGLVTVMVLGMSGAFISRKRDD